MKLKFYIEPGKVSEELQIFMNQLALMGHTVTTKDVTDGGSGLPRAAATITIDEPEFEPWQIQMLYGLASGQAYARKQGKTELQAKLAQMSIQAALQRRFYLDADFAKLEERVLADIEQQRESILRSTPGVVAPMKSSSKPRAPSSKGERHRNKRYRWS